MIVGPFQFQPSQNALERLVAADCVSGCGAAGTGTLGRFAVTVIRIQPLLNSDSGQRQRLASNRHFQGLQIQMVQILATQQRFNIPQNFSGEEAGE